MKDAQLRAVSRLGRFTHTFHWHVDVAGGDKKAGDILGKLLYWEDRYGEIDSPSFGHQHKDHYWVAIPYSAWWDIARITEKEAKRVMLLLKSLGLIMVQIRKFDGTPMQHIRINEQTLKKRMEEIGLLGDTAASTDGHVPSDTPDQPERDSSYLSKKGSKSINPGVAKATPLVSDDKKKKTTAYGVDSKSEKKKKVDQQHGAEKPQQEEQQEQTPEVELSVEELKMKAEETLKQSYKADSAGRKSYRDTGHDVGVLWKKRLNQITGEFVPDLSRKEESQMRRIVELIVNAQSLGSAVDVVDWTMQNWGTFAHRVGVEMGSTLNGHPPLRPNIGFLYEHYAIAVNVFNQYRRHEMLSAKGDGHDEPETLSKPVDVPTIGNEQPCEQPTKEDKPTLEQIAADIQEFTPADPLAA